MTTIAYRAGVMAADVLVTGGGARRGRSAKIRKVGPYLLGAAGYTPLCQAFLDWGARGFRGDPPSLTASPEDTAAAILVAPDRIIHFWDTGYNHITAEMDALGSGSDYALGAMAAGADPEQAVRIASRFDLHTGDEVMVIRQL